jgi:hypothetical protein
MTWLSGLKILTIIADLAKVWAAVRERFYNGVCSRPYESNSPSTMQKFKISSLSLADIEKVVTLKESSGSSFVWEDVSAIVLSDAEQYDVSLLQKRLQNTQVHLFNEATIWARAIYPLLFLVEQGNIQVWAEVALRGEYPQFDIEGIADGVIGRSVVGRITTPYLVVIETKRGVEAQNPIFQLYGELLAAAWMNWQQNQGEVQEIFGCYTIADSWTFLRAEVSLIKSDRPMLSIECSREYNERLETATILKVLKQIVDRQIKN